jgi:N-methylhydantoinase A/oxoprolinase/acetone carboxylase beta subunit/N-methylhydantoinase B/oxoprolinase/acetone carboxylase alpha subunit
MSYFCGVDIGGTFTDCVVLDERGNTTLAKVSSTPPDFYQGFIDALEAVATRLELSLEEFLPQTELLLHGTTVGTNVLVQMRGAKAGLITTRGHGDALIMMRSAGRSAGLTIDQLLHVSRHRKPDPIIPRRRIKEVSERVDWAGDVVLGLNEDEARSAIQELLDEGVEVIAISFLWGFVNPAHELRVKELVNEIAPGMMVCCAHELIGKPGEYERTAAAAVNAFIGPATSRYIEAIDRLTQEHGYRHPLLIMQAAGGVARASDAAERPLFTIASGPVGGVTGAAVLGARLGHPNVIACDMGGTSFDVGVIIDGEPTGSSETVINQYTFFMPRLDIESIGAGGGSLVWADDHGGLRVGPHSAGALPGPVAYGRGGTEPTVTDCDVALGRLNPDTFLGGGLPLDRDAAQAALERVATRVGLSALQTADGALRIVESHMADLMRQMTVERGRDPRDFVVYAFGGAGGVHAVEFARELGAAQVVVPLGDLASTWSALGVLSSDVLHIYEHSELLPEPLDVARINEVFDGLEDRARSQLRDEGFSDGEIEITRLADMKFSLQIHHLEVPVPDGELDSDAAEGLIRRFHIRYEEVYGAGSAFVGAGTQIGLLKVQARGKVGAPSTPAAPTVKAGPVGTREVYWREFDGFRATDVYDGSALGEGTTMTGPAIVDYPDTTVVLPPGSSARVDGLGNIVIDVGGAPTTAPTAARSRRPRVPPRRAVAVRHGRSATNGGAAIRWDGVDHSYIPPDVLDIHPSLVLHEDADEDIDPVTYEVLRHALWNINIEHGQSIIRTSGSPICAYGHDFNPAILDEHAGFVFFGKYNLYLAISSALTVKWMLEHRAESPGIHDGDVFLTNDPWIGSTHQPDVILAAPVFVDGRLFCWVANILHQWDVGGTAPGGFNPMAEDVYWEAPVFPPVKVVDRGELRRDIEELYVRNSRLPQLVNLDLRSQITGCHVARERILRLVERYGSSTVKATMRRVQDDSDAAFGRRLETIPDGTWTEEGWLEVKLPGDRGLYRNRLTLTKRDGRLAFSNAGSSPQGGALNATFGAWSGAILAMLAVTMLFDQMLALEGAMRHCEFDVEPGLLNCASRPAAVSGGPATVLIHTTGLAGLVISKMLSASRDEQLRTEVMSCMGVMGYPVNTVSGLDQRGDAYASFLNDPVGAALPAFSWRDGQDTGGFAWDLESTIPNVEDNELFHPVLYLWRRELPNSGGAGRYRGGNGCEAAVVAHKTERINWVTVAAEVAVPGPGLFGGYPTSTNRYQLVKSAGVHDYLARTGRMPVALAELQGEIDWVGPKTFDRFTGPDDVWVFAWSGGGGYGDPVQREPQAVCDDVAAGRVTREWAAEAYGVIVAGDPGEERVDVAATEERRREIIATRLAEGQPWDGAAAEPDSARPLADGRLSEYVVVEDGEYRVGGVSLGPATRNYKLGALLRDLPLARANPEVRDAKLYVDPEVTFRQVICPETGLLLQTEVVVDGAAPQWDLRPGQTSS